MHRILCILLGLTVSVASAADFTPAGQRFQQEIARSFTAKDGAPPGPIQLIDAAPGSGIRAFSGGTWYEFRQGTWNQNPALAQKEDSQFVLPGTTDKPLTVPIPWGKVHQVVRGGSSIWITTSNECFVTTEDGSTKCICGAGGILFHQIAASPEGQIYSATSIGLGSYADVGPWRSVKVMDAVGRDWGANGVLGVAFDKAGQLWIATKAGAACKTPKGWQFFEGKDGLPWNDFTGAAAGPGGEVWFSTHLGVIRYNGKEWAYRQGPRWLPDDDVAQVLVDGSSSAWFRTKTGLGVIERRSMTLAEKAAFYEEEMQRYVKRTPFGYVSEAPLARPADKTSANPQDSDNDGLWTSMYGAGECFAYGATKDPAAKVRAKQAFEALRFLQKVTQGGPHEPPKGFIARTIRPVEWADPNVGRIEGDREKAKSDKLWKVYEPRWPKSADGKWYWKSDTSSDELDGHYFFYPLYYDLCADTDAEKDRVREVVRDVTDHLIAHGFALTDHDGKPTRWAVYGPQLLNSDPMWWQERGLKSLSMLSYLAVAEHVTGDARYAEIAKELVEKHGYAHNAMNPKVQKGPGSGNQSDDEMAYMSYYGLLNCSRDENLKGMIRTSFYHYWVNDAPEMNPFFNFTYASQCLTTMGVSPWGDFPVKPWAGWHEDSMATLYGFPLDRLHWRLHNSHRLDITFLPPTAAIDVESPNERGERGHLRSGKVIPVENRHFNHWNTDPWDLDYGGNGSELGSGTVFLLPYYMGLYHGFIEKPQ